MGVRSRRKAKRERENRERFEEPIGPAAARDAGLFEDFQRLERKGQAGPHTPISELKSKLAKEREGQIQNRLQDQLDERIAGREKNLALFRTETEERSDLLKENLEGALEDIDVFGGEQKAATGEATAARGIGRSSFAQNSLDDVGEKILEAKAQARSTTEAQIQQGTDAVSQMEASLEEQKKSLETSKTVAELQTAQQQIQFMDTNRIRQEFLRMFAAQEIEATRQQVVANSLQGFFQAGSQAAISIVSMSSDERVKENLQEPDKMKVLAMYKELSPILFDYKDTAKYGAGQRLGIMAQDLEKSEYGKQFVKEIDGVKQVDFGSMLGAIVAAQAIIMETLGVLNGVRP